MPVLSVKMKTVTAYLAHPFSTMAWGFEFTKKLEAIGIKVIDPFDRPGKERLNRPVGLPKEQSKEIVVTDMIKVRQADILIAIVDGSDSKGTHMEFMGASFFLHMPCFTLYTESVKVHPWYVALSYSIARTEEELLEQLKAYLIEPRPYDWGL
jgi:nucleoside 2-deoxyribosyltransferase